MTTIDERLGGLRGSLYTEDNATETVISTQNVAVRVSLGSGAASGPFCGFCSIDAPNSRITYTGPLTRVPTVNVSFVLQGATGATYEVAVRKNGESVGGLTSLVRIPPTVPPGTSIGSGSLVGNVEVSTNDFLEVWVTNRTNTTNATVVDLTMASRG
jgi:hypothetical protein